MQDEATVIAMEGISEEEWRLRIDLAALYRAIDRFGLSDLIYNHITVKVPGDDHYLINPFGLLYSEIKASNLCKIDIDGNIIYQPPSASDFGVNVAGLTIHSAVHKARPDVACVVHTHTKAGMVFAGSDEIIEPVTQYGMLLNGHISYHEYGIPARPEEGEAMVRSLGDKYIMVLRNHGLLFCGPTIPTTFLATYWMEQACRMQVELMMTRTDYKRVDSAIASTLAAAFPMQDGIPEWTAVKRLLNREDPTYAS